MKKPKAKRLVQGRDWHGWVWKVLRDWPKAPQLFFWAEVKKPKGKYPSGKGTGKWVRVKFVEV